MKQNSVMKDNNEYVLEYDSYLFLLGLFLTAYRGTEELLHVRL